jgi:osmotically-inducible protein OsmY
MKEVIVALALCLAACSTFDQTTNAGDDGMIRASVRSNLVSDGFVDVEIVVDQGVVTLTGTLANKTQRAKAAGDAERVLGVKRVIDNITVQ